MTSTGNSDIELEDLTPRRASATAPAPSTLDPVSAYWAWSTAALLGALSAVFFAFPRFILLLSGEQRTELTSIESFFARHGSIWLFAVAVGLVLNVPHSSPADILLSQKEETRHPLLIPLTVASSTCAFLAYNDSSVGSLSTIVAGGSAVIGIWGAWAWAFGNSSAVSKKTGADKHTSAFIFGNKSSASSQKKEWVKQRNTTK
ncbi:hypothetical protein HMN09_00083300 [Mycena chlorophos]|uniref:Transmembrane protein n=1 Tax=Mycena chlorophos TaxID=658473 RepID=A0A8H6WSH5_MYCCL|nr:hypothetical protein HMN09_00083300 [Mycena chlorophos]